MQPVSPAGLFPEPDLPAGATTYQGGIRAGMEGAKENPGAETHTRGSEEIITSRPRERGKRPNAFSLSDREGESKETRHAHADPRYAPSIACIGDAGEDCHRATDADCELRRRTALETDRPPGVCEKMRTLHRR